MHFKIIILQTALYIHPTQKKTQAVKTTERWRVQQLYVSMSLISKGQIQSFPQGELWGRKQWIQVFNNMTTIWKLYPYLTGNVTMFNVHQHILRGKRDENRPNFYTWDNLYYWFFFCSQAEWSIKLEKQSESADLRQAAWECVRQQKHHRRAEQRK